VPTAGGTTRWNPSPDQIRVLEMLYRGGMRTPNSFQIEQITEELGKYGRIEGKNVFYWFQNHKARERHHHKKRRRGACSPDSGSGSGSNEEDGRAAASHDAEADLVLQPPESKREARSYGHHHRLAVTCKHAAHTSSILTSSYYKSTTYMYWPGALSLR